MALASGLYGLILEDSFDASALDINLDTDTVNLRLMTNTYTPNFSTHSTTSDLTGELTTTGGYTVGGQALDSPTWAVSSGLVPYDTADEVWTSATFTCRGGVTVDTTVSNRLLSCADSGADATVSSGTFTYTVPAGGHFSFDVVP